MIPEAAIPPCWPAPASARRLRSSGGFSADAVASPHPGRRRQAGRHRRRQLPPQQALLGAQARDRRGAVARARRSSTSSWSAAPTRRPRLPRAATSGGTTSSPPVPDTPRRPSRPSTRSSSSHIGLRVSRGHLHLRRLPRPRPRTPTTPSSTSSRRQTSTGAPPTSSWVTGHSYIVYGPLANGAIGSCAGHPGHPHQGRLWEIIQKYKVGIFYTAPTAIRLFMKWGGNIPAKFDLSSLRVLGSIRQADQPRAWVWYREHRRQPVPIVDTWCPDRDRRDDDLAAARRHGDQARLGQRPLPGISATVVDDGANEVPERWRRLPGPHRAVAVDTPHHLGRRPALHRHLLVLRGAVLRRRRRQRRTRTATSGCWAGSATSCSRLRATTSHHRGRVRCSSPTRPSPGIRRRRRRRRDDQQAIVAFVILRGTANEDERASSPALRNHVGKTLGPIAKQAGPAGRRAAEDPFRQRSCGAAPGRRREPRAGRRHHADGLVGDGPHQTKLPAASSED